MSSAWEDLVVADGATSLWPFTDTGSALADTIGARAGTYTAGAGTSNVTLKGVPSTATGVPASTVRFANSFDGINNAPYATTGSLPFGGPFTVEIVVTLLGIQPNAANGLLQAGTENNFMLRAGDQGLRTGQLSGNVGGVGWGTLPSNTDLKAGDAYHLAVTYDGTTARLYRNGVQAASVAVATAPSAAPLQVPYDFGALRSGNANVMGLAYTPAALSATRITAHAGTVVGKFSSVSATNENVPIETAANALDGSALTKWLAKSPTASMQWTRPAGMATSYVITSGNDTPARDPKNWTLSGSNDGGTTWTVLDTRTAQSFAARSTPYTFAIATPASYATYKFDVTANNGDASLMQVQGVDLVIPNASGAAATSKVLWLRAKDITATSGNVPTWTGQVGTATQTGSLAGTVVTASTPLGGKAVQFDGNGGYNLGDLGLVNATLIATANSEYTGNEAVKAVDGNASTSWVANGTATASTPMWLRLQPKAGTVATSYAITPRAVYPDHAPRDFTFQGSNDGTAWTTLDTRTGVVWADQVPQTFTFTNTVAYTYYRFYCTAVQNVGCDVSEITINGVPNSLTYSNGELWIVVKGQSTQGPGSWHFGTDTQQNHYPYSGVVYDDFGNATRRSFTPTLDITQWRIYRVTSNGTWTAYLDGVQQTTATAAPQWTRIAVLGMGGPGVSGAGYQGTIAEVIVRPTVSTTQEAADITAYLQAEHFSAAPTTTPVHAAGSVDLDANVAGALRVTAPTTTPVHAAGSVDLDLGVAGTLRVRTPRHLAATTDLDLGLAATLRATAATATQVHLAGAVDVAVQLDSTLRLTAPLQTVPVHLAGGVDLDVSLAALLEAGDGAPPNGGGDILLEVTGDVDTTPSWVTVNVTNGDPDGTADITVDDDTTVALSVDLDESGQAIGVSVPLAALEAGEHVLRTGVASASFTVATGPVVYPDSRVSDAKPVPPSQVNRWALQDPSPGGVTYVFPLNPARMSSPHAARVFTTEHTTAADGQPLTFEGSPVGVDWSFEGTVQTQDFYEALEAFLAAGRRLFCFDHLDRIWEISLESIDWEGMRDNARPWAHRYKAKAIIYGQVQP